MLQEALGDRKLTICRELTKKYETAFRTTFSGALAHYENEEPRGECVIVVEGKSLEEIEKEKAAAWEDMTVEEHMDLSVCMAKAREAVCAGIGRRTLHAA